MGRKAFLRRFQSFLGIVLAGLLIRWVVVRSGIDLENVFRTVDRGYLFAAFSVYGIGVLLAAWRWNLLLVHIGVRLGFPVVLRLAFIGLFFNLFVPGGIGGDLIKMVYLKRESGNRFPQAVLTVLLDRLLGLAGLLLVAVISLGLNRALIEGSSPEMKGALLMVALASGGALVGGILFLLWPMLSRVGSSRFAHLLARLPHTVASVGKRVVEALHLVRAAPGKLVGLVMLSIMGHLTGTVAVYLVGLGIGAEKYLSFVEYVLATQLANLVAAIPLTPGGLGGRDIVMDVFFRAAGAPPQISGALPVLVTVLLVAWSLVGGLALLWERTATPVAGEAEAFSKSEQL